MDHPQGACPICQKNFTPGDDIVICPECGAPYHRTCYQQQGHCTFAAKHAAGFEYAAQGQPASGAGNGAASGTSGSPSGTANTAGPKNTGGVLCSACGTVNDAAHIFCENCGTPLHAQAAQGGGTWQRGAGPLGGAPAYGAASLSLDGEIDGISKRDWVEYIGPSAPQYIARMEQMDRSRYRFSVLFSAFLFSPGYFAYRKMWGWALLSLLATILFMAPYFLYAAADAGIPVFPGITAATWDTVYSVCSWLSLVMQFVFGLFAFTLFRRHAAKHIRVLHAVHKNSGDYRTALSRKGGVSVLAVVCVFLVLFAFSALLYTYFGEAIFDYLMYAGF